MNSTIILRSNGLCLSVDKKSGGGNPDLAFEPCSPGLEAVNRESFEEHLPFLKKIF